MIKQYRKKPVVIEAIKYDGTNENQIIEWATPHVFRRYDKLAVVTLEGDMLVTVGDYIIKGVKGEFYPCKADIFDLTYEGIENENES